MKGNWLERITGREVASVRRYECPKFPAEADSALPEIVIFADGAEELWCPYLNSGACQACEYFQIRRGLKEVID